MEAELSTASGPACASVPMISDRPFVVLSLPLGISAAAKHRLSRAAPRSHGCGAGSASRCWHQAFGGLAALGGAWLRGRRRGVATAAAGAAIRVSEATELSDENAAPTLKSERGDHDVQLLMFRRYIREGANDVLVGRYRRRGQTVWRPFKMKHLGGLRWGAPREKISVVLDSKDVWTALLPGLLGNPKLELCAPKWPKSVMSSLRPWPLKGPGTIVFDRQAFLSNVMDLVTVEQGPVLFPGGVKALRLPTANLEQSLYGRLRPDGLWHALSGGFLKLPIEYGQFLDTDLQYGSGIIDLSRALYGHTEKRTVRLEARPFGMEYQVRTLSCGAVISVIDEGSVADRAGLRLGDAILAVNGKPMFDAKLEEMDKLLEDAEVPLEIQVEQPLLAEPLYLRNADLEFMEAIVPEPSQNCDERLSRRVTTMLGNRDTLSRVKISPQPAKLFVGSGGSATPLHTDDEVAPQMCQVLHGTKFFCITGPFAPPPGTGEFILPTDEPLSPEVADWLANPQVSFAVCRPGDVIAYSGGTPHMGSNAVTSAPCVAIFQALSESSEK